MKKTGVFLLSLALAVILSASILFAESDMTQGSDWKWSYAQTYTNEDLIKLNINNADIEFAKMKVQAAKEDCDEMGGQWCEWYQNDNRTLERMINAKSGISEGVQKESQRTIWQRFIDSIKRLFRIS